MLERHLRIIGKVDRGIVAVTRKLSIRYWALGFNFWNREWTQLAYGDWDNFCACSQNDYPFVHSSWFGNESR